MGPEHRVRSVFFQGDSVSYADIGRTHSLLGPVVAEVAIRLAERVCTVLCCSGAVVVILASVCA